MGENNTKKSNNQQHISIKTTKDTPTLKEDLKKMAGQAGQRFNDFMNKLLAKCVKEHNNNNEQI